MDRTASYRGKTFVVADPDARLRQPDNLMSFLSAPSETEANMLGFARIAQGAEVNVEEVRVVERGSSAPLIFVLAREARSGRELGWTSSRNLAGRFINETLGALPPRDRSSKGPNAAWAEGRFLRQVTLVRIVDARMELAYIALDTLEPYLELCAAATREGVAIAINSGFRTYLEQKQLREGWEKRLPGYNKAAKPGWSKHQNGVAFDFAVAGGPGDPRYDWLTRNAPKFGFVRTVDGEPWHWEHDPPRAAAALAAGTFKTASVNV